MGLNFEFIGVAAKAGIACIPTTLLLALVPFIVGTIAGTVIAMVRIFRVKFLAQLFKTVIDTLKAIPLILVLYILFFIMTDIVKNINMIFVAITALSIFGTVIISETVRGAFMSIDNSQYEAGYSIGLTTVQTLKRIIIPQATPVAVPVLCNNLIGLVKASSIMYLIAVKDILNGSLITASSNYRYLDAYIAAAIVYWVLILTIEQLSRILEKRMGRFRIIVA
jgi:L-cystine transport system permease protein